MEFGVHRYVLAATHPDLKVGESIAKHLLCLEPQDSGYFVATLHLLVQLQAETWLLR
jgi:hypothetical protein